MQTCIIVVFSACMLLQVGREFWTFGFNKHMALRLRRVAEVSRKFTPFHPFRRRSPTRFTWQSAIPRHPGHGRRWSGGGWDVHLSTTFSLFNFDMSIDQRGLSATFMSPSRPSGHPKWSTPQG